MKLTACCSDGLHFIFQSGSWYKFNDEDIVKMQGKLRLSQDEDAAGSALLFAIDKFPFTFEDLSPKVLTF